VNRRSHVHPELLQLEALWYHHHHGKVHMLFASLVCYLVPPEESFDELCQAHTAAPHKGSTILTGASSQQVNA
jgi:hypothetical protein